MLLSIGIEFLFERIIVMVAVDDSRELELCNMWDS